MKTSFGLLPILFLACCMPTPHALAQEAADLGPQEKRLSAGISAGHYSYDPGLAIEFTTRPVFQDHVSLRIRGSLQWLEAYQAAQYNWISYQTIATGLVYNGKLFDRTRFYAEFGMLGIIPNAKVSEKAFVEGFYEFNGLEITLLSRKNYKLCFYFGVGPAFINASAEKLEGNPHYGNGLHFINGFRAYFGSGATTGTKKAS
jgi:hypothetical protein